MNTRRPVVLDLFSGAGGMSLGFEAAGFDIGGCIELDPIHSAVHLFNFPYSATICKSISDVTVNEIEKTLTDKGYNQVDVIVGGPPCQGFSQIGKRQLDDPRNSLVFEYLRIVRDMKPKYFVFENVKGMTLGDHKFFVNELVGEFNKEGYNVISPYKVLNAAAFGVAQNRWRFILIGVRKDQQEITYPPATHYNFKGHETNLFSKNYIGSQTALEDLAILPVYYDDDQGISYDLIHYNQYTSQFHFRGSDAFKLCHTRSFTDNLVFGHSGSKHTPLSQERFAATQCGSTELVSRFFKLHPEKPSNTLRAGTDSKRGAYTAARPIHYSNPRCITIREGARLHSFPDWFQFHTTIWHGFRQLGNSVAPLFAKTIGEQIISSLKINTNTLLKRELEVSDETLVRMSMREACNFLGVPDVIGKRDRKLKAIAT